MKSNKVNTNKLKISKFVYVIVFFLFTIFGLSLGYRCLVDYEATKGVSISEFIQNMTITPLCFNNNNTPTSASTTE